jgi:hypothetical protein
MRVIAILLTTLIAACAGAERGDRSTVPVEAAVRLFLDTCYEANQGLESSEARLVSAGFEVDRVSDDLLFASDTDRAVDVLLGSSSCQVSFDSGMPAVDTGAMAAETLINLLDVEEAKGREGGGHIGLVTPKGDVVVGNATRVRGMLPVSIALYAR